jgi:hypothetical protein
LPWLRTFLKNRMGKRAAWFILPIFTGYQLFLAPLYTCSQHGIKIHRRPKAPSPNLPPRRPG